MSTRPETSHQAEIHFAVFNCLVSFIPPYETCWKYVGMFSTENYLSWRSIRAKNNDIFLTGHDNRSVRRKADQMHFWPVTFYIFARKYSKKNQSMRRDSFVIVEIKILLVIERWLALLYTCKKAGRIKHDANHLCWYGRQIQLTKVSGINNYWL